MANKGEQTPATRALAVAAHTLGCIQGLGDMYRASPGADKDALMRGAFGQLIKNILGIYSTAHEGFEDVFRAAAEAGLEVIDVEAMQHLTTEVLQ
jgi:hypothetical protein